MRYRISYLFIFSFLLHVHSIFPQTLPFRNYTVEDGLGQSRAYAVLQDSKGYIWIGTQDGVSRFDGSIFRTYTTDDGIVNNRILAMMQDHNDNIWLGTAGGVTVIRENEFYNFTKTDGLAGALVHDIVQENDRSIWIATEEGLSNFINGSFVNYFAADGLPDNLIYSLYRDGAGTIWVGTAKGYTVLERDSSGHIVIGNSELTVPVMVFQEDIFGSMWIGTDGEGLYAIRNDGIQKHSIGNNKIYSLYTDEDSVVWVGTYGKGIYKFSNGTVTNYSDRNGLPNPVIRSIIKDREGNMWFGTYGGLAFLRDERIAYYTEDHGLTNNIVMAITMDPEKTLLFGTYGGGVVRFLDNEFEDFSIQAGLKHNVVRAILTDSKGTVWIGTHGGVTRVTGHSNYHYTVDDGLAGNIILSVFEDSRGNIWFGTFRDGLSYMNGDRIHNLNVTDGLSHNTVRAIAEDHNGVIWFGTDNGLSYRHNGSFGTMSTDDGLAYNVIRSLTVDSSGKLWIATDGGGLSVYDRNSFRNITTADGLSNNVCYFVLEDDDGHFWIGTNKGLNRYNPQTGSIKVYTTQHGLPSNEMNTNAAFKDDNGNLWFGTVNGVVRFNTNAEKRNLISPPVYLTRIQVYEEERPVSSHLKLRHNENYLKFEFLGLSFASPGDITYRYMLEGIDNDWQESKLRNVQYTSLAPGSYTFKVSAGTGEGIWSETPAEIRCSIIPPYWATWWFRTLIILGASAVLGLLYHNRVTTLTNERRNQEEFSKRLIDSQEKERKRIAAELHDSLGQNLLIIKNHALLGLKDSDTENSGEHLHEISDLASQTINEVREISYNLRPYQLDRLGLKAAIESIVEKINSTTSIRCTASLEPIDNEFPKEVETNIYRIIQECLNNIVKHSGAGEALVAARSDLQGITLTIQDDGKGFSLEDGELNSYKGEGFGLRGIAERVKILRGTVRIESSPGNGTTIVINIPGTVLQNG
jgi:signal transduction histidine kinase/ligand-binding sensor domain-containing protein